VRSLSVRDDYELELKHATPSSIQGLVFHVTRTPAGERISQEVGSLSAWEDPGDYDAYRPHWKVMLFLISTYEYDAKAQVTVTPGGMERHSWSQWHGIEVSPNALPPYHPELPCALAEVLLRAGYCSKPLWVELHHCRFVSHIEHPDFGDVVSE